MTDRICKVCGKPASTWTVFGMNLGNFCNRCHRETQQRMMQVAKPLLSKIRVGAENALESKQCEKCGDKLTGHEDDSSTRCRWCVTCQDVGTVGEAKRGSR